MKKLFTLITITLAIIIYILFYSFYFKDGKTKPLVIGMMNGYAPFMTINKYGEMEGFDVDICKEIEKKINREIIIKDLGSLASLFIALEQETVDAILSGLDVTEKRKKDYDFVLYENDVTRFNTYCCITTKSGPQNENDLKNNSYIIGIEPALSWEATLNKYILLKKTYINSISDMIIQLQQNKIDCFVIEPTQCKRIKKVIPDLNYFSVEMDPSIKIDGIGIFIKKNNTAVKNILQDAINSLEEDKKIENITKKWNIG
jgi:ABC-type amino acid transport substrate-binding protein